MPNWYMTKTVIFARVSGSQIRTVVNLIAENDDDARKKARRAIYHFLA